MVDIRAAFEASDGYVLLSADYAQLELRLMAFLSRDKAMVWRLQAPGADLFRELASLWLRKPIDQVRHVNRAAAAIRGERGMKHAGCVHDAELHEQ